MYLFFGQSFLLVTGKSFNEEHNAWPIALNQQCSLRAWVTCVSLALFSITDERSKALQAITIAHAVTQNKAGKVGIGDPDFKTELLSM